MLPVTIGKEVRVLCFENWMSWLQVVFLGLHVCSFLSLRSAVPWAKHLHNCHGCPSYSNNSCMSESPRLTRQLQLKGVSQGRELGRKMPFVFHSFQLDSFISSWNLYSLSLCTCPPSLMCNFQAAHLTLWHCQWNWTVYGRACDTCVGKFLNYPDAAIDAEKAWG